VIGLIALYGCQQHAEAPPVAAVEPPPPPPAPPPPPTEDDKLQGELTQLNAAPGSQGWTLSLESGKFTGLKVAFDDGDTTRLGKVADLMKSSPNLRLQIETFPDNRGSKSHRTELAQMHANSVLRDLSQQGADEDRMQAFASNVPLESPPAGTSAKPHPQVNIIFSNAEGEFKQAAASQ
jgi:outer membrane protein OmpA-like peptidoglycan-associated protein